MINLLTVIVCILPILLILWWKKKPQNFPPGFDGFPLIGCLPYLVSLRERKVTAWGKEMKWPIFYIALGPFRVVILNSYESIREGFVTNGKCFSERYLPNFVTYNKNGFLFLDKEHRWMEQRKFAISTLREFGMGKRSIESKIYNEASYLCHDVLEVYEKGKLTQLELRYILQNSIANVICQLVFNQRYDREADYEFLQRLQPDYKKFSSIKDQIAFVLRIFPLVKNIKFVQECDKAITKVEEDSTSCVQELIESHKETITDDVSRDFTDVFLKKIKQAEKSGEVTTFTEKQLIGTSLDIFLAGFETTSNAIEWAVLFLAKCTDKQKRLRDEIESVIGSKLNDLMSKIDDMPYLQAVVQEALRIRPPIPYGVPRSAKETCRIMGYVIPKGTFVLTNLWGVNHDADIWNEPDCFAPERHLDENGCFVKSNKVMTFSIGPRDCIGIGLAKMEMYIFLSALLQKFHFFVPPVTDLSEVSFVMEVIPPNVEIKFEAL